MQGIYIYIYKSSFLCSSLAAVQTKMISSSQTADLEARFGHILQPIRDLTRNWDVDIASYLEEYLDDVSFVRSVSVISL